MGPINNADKNDYAKILIGRLLGKRRPRMGLVASSPFGHLNWVLENLYILKDETVKHAFSLELTNRFDALDFDSLSLKDHSEQLCSEQSKTFLSKYFSLRDLIVNRCGKKLPSH